jgi:16S rRNA (cytidine1402-2'-O)-methyltransferase
MPGTLYVVATPIGNLADITLRALRVLREVSLIAAEDTRRTARLLQHYSISTPTTSLHEHNERRKSSSLIERLKTGQSVALVSDAGTPGVSDPGAALVSAAHAAAIRVEPVPGPSAAIAALSGSGFHGPGFLFAGFPPYRSHARRQWLVRLASESRPFVLHEAPHRIRETLKDMLSILGDRPIAVARELTKAHESLVVRPISWHIEQAAVPRGEYTLVVPVAESDPAHTSKPSAEQLGVEFGDLTKHCLFPPRQAIKQLAKKYALPAREIYAAVHGVATSGGEE